MREAEGINPPKRTRGRPKKDTIPAPEMSQGTVVASNIQALPAGAAVSVSPQGAVTVTEAPIEIAVAEQAEDEARRTKSIETLCVGCMPVGHTFTSLDGILADARDMIGDAAYFGGYGYKTNGMMIEAVKKLLVGRTIEVLVVPNPNLPEAALVLSHLRAMAAVTIEALR